MPPQQTTGTPSSRLNIQTATTILALIVAGLSIFAGFQLARGNADVVCSTSVSETGSCTGGSWSAWTTESQSGSEVTERRVYTGTRQSISGSFSISGNIHALNYCNLSTSAYAGAQGSITTSQSACQIEERRVRSTGGGGGAGGSTGSFQILSETRSESTGELLGSTTTTGTYAQYLGYVDASLATSSIRAIPSLVRSGDRTRVIWTSDRAVSCTVVGSNGDAWEALLSPPEGELSQPITQRTTFTLSCLTPLGNLLGGEVVVNIIPTFEEQ